MDMQGKILCARSLRMVGGSSWSFRGCVLAGAVSSSLAERLSGASLTVNTQAIKQRVAAARIPLSLARMLVTLFQLKGQGGISTRVSETQSTTSVTDRVATPAELTSQVLRVGTGFPITNRLHHLIRRAILNNFTLSVLTAAVCKVAKREAQRVRLVEQADNDELPIQHQV